MRNVLLALVVWALLYGVAEILGVMPEVTLPFASDEARTAPSEVASGDEAGRGEEGRADALEPSGSPEPEPSGPDAGLDGGDLAADEPAAPAEASDAGPPVGTDEPVEAPADDPVDGAPAARESEPEADGLASTGLCRRAKDAPRRLLTATLPNGAGALLVDCGEVAELLVPAPDADEAIVVARFTFTSGLSRVESKDLTGDGLDDLAFAFADRVVLLPSSPFGVWSGPKSLEGWTGGAVGRAPRRGRRAEARATLGDVTYVARERDGSRELVVVDPARGEDAPLRIEVAPLLYEAELR